jgi:hypothetical protein
MGQCWFASDANVFRSDLCGRFQHEKHSATPLFSQKASPTPGVKPGVTNAC